MPIPRYGVLKGKALEGKLAGKSGKKPHYQIHMLAAGEHHRIAVNVKSDQSPSELLFLLDPDFSHPVLDGLPALPDGFTPVPSRPGGLALDFIRQTLFDPQDMKALPHNVPGPDNDLNEIFSLYLRRAIEREADLYAFGSKWGPENKADDYFGFKPGNGIHDIHLNQGSPPPHKHDNGVWQDGALFIHFPATDEWLGFFLAFQSQHASTDERGDPIPGSPKFGQKAVALRAALPATLGVRIVAALVNPAGDGAGQETVTLLNTRPSEVNLAGLVLTTESGATFALPQAPLAAGEAVRIPVGVALSDTGGTLSLFDHAGIKIDGVAYTKEQAGSEGWTVAF